MFEKYSLVHTEAYEICDMIKNKTYFVGDTNETMAVKWACTQAFRHNVLNSMHKISLESLKTESLEILKSLREGVMYSTLDGDDYSEHSARFNLKLASSYIDDAIYYL